MKKIICCLFATLFMYQCQQGSNHQAEEKPAATIAASAPFSWNSATIYFLLTDRFYNGNPDNDVHFGRDENPAPLRGFMGGDMQGITHKIEEGYFDSLGVNAIWLTPVVEQIHGGTDEGTGFTYGYHGYWTRDWTSLDPNFGTEQDLQKLVDTAHEHGIRILLDVVLNHTGPVTTEDPAWPDSWVRQDPTCTYQDYETTVSCTLVENLPDIHTGTEEAVALPDFLQQKWQEEGRLEQELTELEEFFQTTGYPRAPRFYIIKWLTDFVRTYGIDGFRVDTAKHTEAFVWAELKKEAMKAFAAWKAENPDKKLDDETFFMTGEVYGYGAGGGRAYDYGDKKVDFYEHGFESLINFSFKYDALESYEALFTKYDRVLHEGPLQGVGILNYLSSHDDGDPFDQLREKTLEAGTRLLLSPGAAQIYYGDETARPLLAENAEGDANLRTFMNWEAIQGSLRQDSLGQDSLGQDSLGQDSLALLTLSHWSRIGRFRHDHMAVGSGKHQKHQDTPYIFSRQYADSSYTDQVLVALDVPQGRKSLPVFEVFADGTQLKDYYSGQTVTVEEGTITLSTPYSLLLLAAE